MNEQDQTTRPSGRSITVTVFGDNVAEIELAALDEARSFFGQDLQLEIIHDYHVHPARSALGGKASEKKHVANIQVRAVE